MRELSLEKVVLLPSYHCHDNIEQYDPQEVLAAMKKEIDIYDKNIYVDCSESQLSAQQPRKIVKTTWAIADRPDASTATSGELRARFVAKGCSQQVHNPMVDAYAATPSNTSLKTILLLGILAGYQKTSLDISTAFINTPTTGFRREIRTITTRMAQRLAPQARHALTTY